MIHVPQYELCSSEAYSLAIIKPGINTSQKKSNKEKQTISKTPLDWEK